MSFSLGSFVSGLDFVLFFVAGLQIQIFKLMPVGNSVYFVLFYLIFVLFCFTGMPIQAADGCRPIGNSFFARR